MAAVRRFLEIPDGTLSVWRYALAVIVKQAEIIRSICSIKRTPRIGFKGMMCVTKGKAAGKWKQQFSR
jgi:hypothetical protein